MANTSANDWDETSPALSHPRRDGAGEIRFLRQATRLRADKEHVAAATAGAGGEHKEGSARAYYQAAAPTLRPDGSTALGASDDGRLWVDSDDKAGYVWDGSAWVAMNAPSLSSFHKETTQPNSAGNPTSTPFTQSGLSAGTWMVWIYGTVDEVSGSSSYDITATINGVTRHLYVDNHPDGTAPFMIPFIVTVTGAGTVSLTAETSIYRVQAMTGFRLSS